MYDWRVVYTRNAAKPHLQVLWFSGERCPGFLDGSSSARQGGRLGSSLCRCNGRLALGDCASVCFIRLTFTFTYNHVTTYQPRLDVPSVGYLQKPFHAHNNFTSKMLNS